MKSVQILTLADARRIIDAAKHEAANNGWNMCIAVCDAGGHTMLLERMDGAPPMSAQIAPAKANTSVLGGKPSQVFEDMINQGRVAALAMPILPMGGGVPVVRDGHVVGAVGVSGAKPQEDAQVAEAGIATLNANN